MPVGYFTSGLSENGKEQLKALFEVNSLQSQTVKAIVKDISLGDAPIIMDELVSALKQVSSFESKPKGFLGACLLASAVQSTAPGLVAFVKSIPKKPAWMSTILKAQTWYKE